MYLGISIAFAVAACAEAVIQARRASRLAEALKKQEEVAVCYQQTANACADANITLEHERCEAVRRAELLQKALGESEESCCRLRKTVHDCRGELACETQAHDACTKMLTEVKDEVEQLKKERRKLEEALMEEHESAAHWHDECKKEYFARLTTEGRVAREWANMLSYDGTSKGQKDADEEEYPYEY